MNTRELVRQQVKHFCGMEPTGFRYNIIGRSKSDDMIYSYDEALHTLLKARSITKGKRMKPYGWLKKHRDFDSNKIIVQHIQVGKFRDPFVVFEIHPDNTLIFKLGALEIGEIGYSSLCSLWKFYPFVTRNTSHYNIRISHFLPMMTYHLRNRKDGVSRTYAEYMRLEASNNAYFANSPCRIVKGLAFDLYSGELLNNLGRDIAINKKNNDIYRRKALMLKKTIFSGIRIGAFSPKVKPSYGTRLDTKYITGLILDAMELRVISTELQYFISTQIESACHSKDNKVIWCAINRFWNRYSYRVRMEYKVFPEYG